MQTVNRLAQEEGVQSKEKIKECGQALSSRKTKEKRYVENDSAVISGQKGALFPPGFLLGGVDKGAPKAIEERGRYAKARSAVN